VFESALTTVSFAFVGHHEYHDFDVLGLAPTKILEDGTLIEILGVGFLSFYLNYMLTFLQAGLVGLVDNCDSAVDDTPHHICLYARFDDLRAAAASKEMFESALTAVTFNLADHHEYYDSDTTHPRAQAVSAYDCQVEFIAMPKSVAGCNLQAMFTEVRGFIQAFVPVRTFPYVETKGFRAPNFCAEGQKVGQTPSFEVLVPAGRYPPLWDSPKTSLTQSSNW